MLQARAFRLNYHFILKTPRKARRAYSSPTPQPRRFSGHRRPNPSLSDRSPMDMDENVFSLHDILEYLDQVESHLRRPSEHVSGCHYSYQSDNDDTFFKYVGATLAKPMLRTLIYGGILSGDGDSDALRLKQRTEKVIFDERIREERVSLEFDRMSSFVLHHLRPASLNLDKDLRDYFIPELNSQIKVIETAVRDILNGKKIEGKSLIMFSRLASGRQYKGQLNEMVNDLFPHLSEMYLEASRKVTERDVMERLIQLELVNNNQTYHEDEFFKRRIRAARECLDIFYTSEDGTRIDEREKSAEKCIASGKIAEEACLRYIEKQHRKNHESCTILTNVFVNTRRNTELNDKYKPPRTRRNKSTIIWTDQGDSDRHRVCSEFDVLLLQNLDAVKSVWECKRTISPSTLHDILSKKLGAIELLLCDENSELVYQDGNLTKSVPFFREHQGSITFGIYGMELLHPINAADSIRSVAGANVVSSDLNEVIKSIERCIDNKNSLLLVEVNTQRTLHIIGKLKNLIRAKLDNEKSIRIMMHIDSDVNFELRK